MKEQVKLFWSNNKEKIKTGVILVVTPVAILGLMGLNATSKMIDMAHMAATDEMNRRKA